jgi:hypothetical protein
MSHNWIQLVCSPPPPLSRPRPSRAPTRWNPPRPRRSGTKLTHLKANFVKPSFLVHPFEKANFVKPSFFSLYRFKGVKPGAFELWVLVSALACDASEARVGFIIEHPLAPVSALAQTSLEKVINHRCAPRALLREKQTVNASWSTEFNSCAFNSCTAPPPP